MKKTIFFSLFFASSLYGHSQVRMTGITNSTVSSSAFIDASSNNTNNISLGTGKGLVFPRVDLSTFVFLGITGIASNFPSRFDGMIVYNTKDGGSANVGTTSGILTPGFWFYENKSTTTTGGTWKPIAMTTKDITTTEVILSTKVNGAQLYAKSGSFVASGTSALITLALPSGITGYYSFVVYKNNKTFRTGIYSIDMLSSTNNAVTGNGFFSEVYPAGSYDYVIEYFK